MNDAEMAQLVAALEDSEQSAKQELEARQAMRVGCGQQAHLYYVSHYTHLRCCSVASDQSGPSARYELTAGASAVIQ